VLDLGLDMLPHYELAAIPILDGAERPAEWPEVKRRLRAEGVRSVSHRGALLLEPGEMDRFASVGLLSGNDELLLCTDVRAAAPHARFGLPEVKWSVYPFGGATVKLVQQIGYVHAMELLITAGLIDATEAARIGLINRVVPAARLMPWALETAERIAANSPSAVQAVKRQVSATSAEHARAREALDQALGDRVRASAHFREGVSAFREKRQPRYD